MKTLRFLILLLLPVLSLAQAPALSDGKYYQVRDGIVRRTYDGDTPGIQFSGVDTITTCRVLYLDSPESSVWFVSKSQPGGKAATDTAHAVLIGKTVRVAVFGKDRYNRPLVMIWVNGFRFDEYMLKRGMAWYVPLRGVNYYPNSLTLKGGLTLQKQAQATQVGLFNKKVYPSRALLPATWRVKYRR